MTKKTLLIANRGEIARRIGRTARRMGYRVAAVCSEVDQAAPFVKEADAHVVLGPAAPKDSYLRPDRVLEAAEQMGATLIHPGYGFLSENAAFARAVTQAGLRFVGPRPDTMEKVGAKLSARKAAAEAAVPVVPGSEAVTSAAEAQAEANRLGYPVLLKASAGGGGIGMTRVDSADAIERAFADAAKKGQMFFGDPTVYVEKCIEAPAHVEVQILGDQHGRVIGLGERDCSVQRRHQKVLEESPSPRLDPATRQKMIDAAVRLGTEVGYQNAGTVEMIYAGGGDLAGQFFFLEVNARLQVEHPVTEMVFGIDLVEWQLRIAEGEAIPDALAEASPSGHAIEARICAEDPEKRFFPSPGTLTTAEFPEGPGIRVDAGVAAGSVVSPAYDSLLAKLIVHGKDRSEAIERLKAASTAIRLEGVRHNSAVFARIADDPVFGAGAHDTGFLKDVLGYRY